MGPKTVKLRELHCEETSASPAPLPILLHVLQMTRKPSCDLQSSEYRANPTITCLRVVQIYGNRHVPYSRIVGLSLVRPKSILHCIASPPNGKQLSL